VVELWDVERPCPLLAAPREDLEFRREPLVEAIERAFLHENDARTELLATGEGGIGYLLKGVSATYPLMAEGRTNVAISRALVVTPGAVEKHVSNIFSKLDLPATDDDHRRVLAVLTFLRTAA
jgi:hypothetical protein